MLSDENIVLWDPSGGYSDQGSPIVLITGNGEIIYSGASWFYDAVENIDAMLSLPNVEQAGQSFPDPRVKDYEALSQIIDRKNMRVSGQWRGGGDELKDRIRQLQASAKQSAGWI